MNDNLITAIYAYTHNQKQLDFYIGYVTEIEDEDIKTSVQKTIDSYTQQNNHLYEYIIINFKDDLDAVNKTLKQNLNGE